MRGAEEVTFGGGGLDRRADLRGQPEAIDAALAAGAAGVVALWQGKPLVTDATEPALVRLDPAHKLIAGRRADLMLMGDAAGQLILACDLSDLSVGGDSAPRDGFLDTTRQSHPDLPAGSVFVELRALMARLDRRDAEIAATARAMQLWHQTHGFCARCGAPSVIAEAGWRRDCPSCGGQHFPRTDPVVIMLIIDGRRVLMGRSPGWPEGMYSLLAGYVEPGETIEAAVRRETAEETGIAVGAVGYLASQPWPFPSSLMIGCHGLATSTRIEIDPNEIEDARWFTQSELIDAMAGTKTGTASGLKPARQGAIARFLIDRWLADRLD